MKTLSKWDRTIRRVGYKLAVLAASGATFGLVYGLAGWFGCGVEGAVVAILGVFCTFVAVLEAK
jgi:hypothetical protein